MCLRVLIVVVLVSQSARAAVDFDAIDAFGAGTSGVGGAVLDNYLSGFGVTLTNVTSGTEVKVFDDRFQPIADAPSNFNFLTQAGLGGVNFGSRGFTLNLANPASGVSFSRVALSGSASDRYPAWQAQALDGGGGIIDSVGESQFAFTTPVSAQSFSLIGSGIDAVRFSTNYQGEIFSSVHIDNLSIRPIPEPSGFFVALLLCLCTLFAGRWRRR